MFGQLCLRSSSFFFSLFFIFLSFSFVYIRNLGTHSTPPTSVDSSFSLQLSAKWWQDMRGSFDKDSGHLPFEKLTSFAEPFYFFFARRKTLKVRSFPAHQASAELMNPRGPASALRPEHYSRARQGGRKGSCQCRYASASGRAHTQADHDCGSYGVTGVPRNIC